MNRPGSGARVLFWIWNDPGASRYGPVNVRVLFIRCAASSRRYFV